VLRSLRSFSPSRRSIMDLCQFFNNFCQDLTEARKRITTSVRSRGLITGSRSRRRFWRRTQHRRVRPETPSHRSCGSAPCWVGSRKSRWRWSEFERPARGNVQKSRSANFACIEFSEVRCGNLRAPTPRGGDTDPSLGHKSTQDAPICHKRGEEALQAVATCYRRTSREFQEAFSVVRALGRGLSERGRAAFSELRV
jgi:hypothetical protein